MSLGKWNKDFTKNVLELQSLNGIRCLISFYLQPLLLWRTFWRFFSKNGALSWSWICALSVHRQRLEFSRRENDLLDRFIKRVEAKEGPEASKTHGNTPARWNQNYWCLPKCSRWYCVIVTETPWVENLYSINQLGAAIITAWVPYELNIFSFSFTFKSPSLWPSSNWLCWLFHAGLCLFVCLSERSSLSAVFFSFLLHS